MIILCRWILNYYYYYHCYYYYYYFYYYYYSFYLEAFSFKILALNNKYNSLKLHFEMMLPWWQNQYNHTRSGIRTRKKEKISENWWHYHDATSVSTSEQPTSRSGGIETLFCLTSDLTNLIKWKKGLKNKTTTRTNNRIRISCR